MGHFVRYNDSGDIVASGTMDDKHIDALRASGENIARAETFVPLDGSHEFSHEHSRAVKRADAPRRLVENKSRSRENAVAAAVARILVDSGLITSRGLRARLRRAQRKRR